MSPTIFISAGEASGEHYGALLATSLKQQLAQAGKSATLFGMGGERMQAAGVERIVRSEDVSVMGITEVLAHLPKIYREFRKLKKAIRTRRPDVAVLIDFPDFHFRLAREFHRLGVPVVYFVSPQLWAWKKHRIRLVQKYVRRMLVIFPFEEAFYKQNSVEAEFVGHPLAEVPQPAITRQQFASENSLDPTAIWIGILPGSRPQEIRDHLPDMLEAARNLAKAHKQAFEFLVPLAPTLNIAQRALVHEAIQTLASDLTVRLVEDARAALFHARVSVVASGTATVEAALIGNPFVVVYRVSHLTYAIAKRVVKVPHVAMANLIAGKRVVPELIQKDFTAANVIQQVELLLPDGPVRESMIKDLGTIREALSAHPLDKRRRESDAIERVAAITIGEISAGFPSPTELAVKF
ncbi:MAG TPA: lipid-A-disaccharide synthase [Terracidiphilus sp.]|nr:lipid-A-disaccharide synthase [Terracidiphilus sp.]